MKRRKKIQKQFKILVNLTKKKGKVLKKIFKELNKKKWTCAKCEELLQIIYNPELARTGTKKGMIRKTSRRAFMNGRKKSNPQLKEVMRLHHKEGYTLKEAWAEVR